MKKSSEMNENKIIFFKSTSLKIGKSFTLKESLYFIQLFLYNLNLIKSFSGYIKEITASAYSFTEEVNIPH